MAGTRRAIVLGGGVAGLRAAFELVDRGYAVELLEGRRALGGRAFTLPDRGMREPCDNGPHVMLGCYVEMRALLRRLGTEDGFERPRSLRLAYRDAAGRSALLRLPPGPAPLWFGAALLGVRGLGVGGWLRAIRGLGSVLRDCPESWTVEDWLRARGQGGAPRRFLWDPMCRAIMNAEPDRVEARLLLRTLRRAFLGSGRAAAIWSPRRPWSELLGQPAHARLETEGVRVRYGASVESIVVERGRVTALGLAGGAERLAVGADQVVVSALPWHALARALPDGLLPATVLAGAPIVSVYFETDGDARMPPDPLIALVDGAPFHFVARRPGGDPGAFAVLSGGGAGLEGSSAAETVAAARAQVLRHFPQARIPEASTRVRLAKEARATILAAPGSGAVRPAPGPLRGVEGLVVCGDWTATGLPSTLEGAAESAVRAVATLGGVRDVRGTGPRS